MLFFINLSLYKKIKNYLEYKNIIINIDFINYIYYKINNVNQIEHFKCIMHNILRERGV